MIAGKYETPQLRDGLAVSACICRVPVSAPQLLFGSQPRDRGIDHFASDADDLDLVVDSEFLTDRGFEPDRPAHA
jgi:hypothetical protein